MGYPTFYPSEGQPTGPYANPLHPSHSIHVGAPNVNVDVQTTREHVAQRPEEEVSFMCLLLVLINFTKGAICVSDQRVI